MANKRLIEVCDIQYGYPFDSSHFSDAVGGMPLIRIRDVKAGKSDTYYSGNYPKEYIIHKGDYLIGMDGEFNIAPWASEDALLNQRVCKISSKSQEVNIRFVYRYLIKELKHIEEETPFVTVKHLSAKRLNQIYFNVPPLAEQERIVAELDLLTEIIDKQKAQLKELDALAQSIFYDMFGDPVENEKGWKVKKLGTVLKTTSGGTPAKSHPEYYEGGDILWINSGDLHQTYVYSVPKRITKEGLSKSSAKLFPIDTVLVAMYGATVGEVSILKVESATNQAVCGIFPDSSYNTIFLYSVLKHSKSHFIELAAGGAQPNISQTIIKDFDLITPPIDSQKDFADKINAIEQQKAAITQSIAETQKLFDYTMDKYFG